MAQRYVQAATQQLAPGYDQQIQALQSQVPAIQQLYQSLLQGLSAQQAAGNQGILEDASGRGLLNSTIPVQGQVQLGQQILGQQGQYGAQQLKDIGGINSQIAGIRTDQATGIANLANSLAGTDLQQQQFNYDKQQQSKQYQLLLKAARQGF